MHLQPSAGERRSEQESGDLELFRALRRGEERALEAIVDRKSGPLTATVYRLVGNREDARDLVQLAFVRAWENRRRYNERWSPNTWLYRIATNLAIDFLRARGSRDRAEGEARLELVHGRSASPDLSRLEAREVDRILNEVAAVLAPRQRAAFLLREVEDFDTVEVARMLGCRPSTVRNHLFTARTALRRELARRYPEYASVESTHEEDG